MAINDTVPMVAIAAARAQIGAPDRHLDQIAGVQHYDRSWFADETPQHLHTLEPFQLDVHPVTNRQWAAFAHATGYRTSAERRGFGLCYGATFWEQIPGACWHTPDGRAPVQGQLDHPVVHVDHADATSYATWAGKRLPGEAEWEHAAHGPHWRVWPWGDQFDPKAANCAEHWAGASIGDFAAWRAWWATRPASDGYLPATTPVRSFPAGNSPYGVTDMAGNVAEWTASTYQPYNPHGSGSFDPVLQAAFGRYRTVRGGSWMHFRFQVRTTERIAIDPAYSSFQLGFRCAADPAR